MLKAKPVWFSLDVFKADPGGYSAARTPVLLASWKGLLQEELLPENIPSRALCAIRERDRIAVQATNTRLIGIRPRLISGRASQSGR